MSKLSGNDWVWVAYLGLVAIAIICGTLTLIFGAK